MHLEQQLAGGGRCVVENVDEDFLDELHRGEVVVVHHDMVASRCVDCCVILFDDEGFGTCAVVTHGVGDGLLCSGDSTELFAGYP